MIRYHQLERVIITGLCHDKTAGQSMKHDKKQTNDIDISEAVARILTEHPGVYISTEELDDAWEEMDE